VAASIAAIRRRNAEAVIAIDVTGGAGRHPSAVRDQRV
jgi:hypothetical protein